jgi:hypothetical protein
MGHRARRSRRLATCSSWRSKFWSRLAKRRIPYEYREICPRVHDWRILNEEIPAFLDKLDKLDDLEPGREETAERRNR